MVLRHLITISLSFAGFLRFDELSELRCKDVLFLHNLFYVKIRKAKLINIDLDTKFLLQKEQLCPYRMLQRYIEAACIDLSSKNILFRQIIRSRDTCKLIQKYKSLSYNRIREVILAKLKIVAPSLNLGPIL